jgi:V/A-type H+-transporting ATPase subunit I
MFQIRVLVLEREEQTLLRAIGRVGIVEIRSEPAGPDSAPLPARDDGGLVADCRRRLARIGELRRTLGLTESGQRPSLPALPTGNPAADLAAMEERVRGLIEERQRLRTRRDELAAAMAALSSYREVDLPVHAGSGHDFLHFVAGSLPTPALPDFRRRIGTDVALLLLPPDGGRQPVIAFTPRTSRPALDKAIAETDFRATDISSVTGDTPASRFEAAGTKAIRVREALGEIETAITALAPSAGTLLARMEEDTTQEVRLLDARACLTRTESAVLITGWVPASRRQVVEHAVRAATGGRCVVEYSEPGDFPDAEPPVLLRTPALLRPFAMLLRAFGLPAYREVDPTAFLAVSYLIMFGMMFGDVGHGALLAGGGLLAWRAGRSENLRNAGMLLVYGGASSMVFGVLYGSYFGIERMKDYALWRDPLHGNATHFLLAALAFSVVLISTGVILNIVNRFRRGDTAGGWLDRFGIAGLVFYWGGLALLAKYAAIRERGALPLCIALFIAMPVIAWTVREPVERILRRRRETPETSKEDRLARVESLVSAFEAVFTYVANTVSFVRLAAYAMSHAALLFATFTLAAQVERAAGGPSFLSILVIVAGNLLAIALEGVIASLQALRLEFYEFFGKFFAGSGRPFQPFRL